MTDNWFLYFLMKDDWVHSVGVNLGIRDQVPDLALPSVTRLHLDIFESNNGMAVGDESALLDMIGETFEDLTEPKGLASRISTFFTPKSGRINLHYVGRITGNNVRTYFYYHNGEIPSSVYERLSAQFPTRSFKVDSSNDPQWTLYLKDLHPGAALNPLIMSVSQLEFRESKSDDMPAERDVDHTLFFPSTDAREKFIEYVRNDGWKFRNFDTSGDGSKYGVDLTKSHRIDKMWSDVYVVALSSRAEKFGGYYDGWGAPIVPKKN